VSLSDENHSYLYVYQWLFYLLVGSDVDTVTQNSGVAVIAPVLFA